MRCYICNKRLNTDEVSIGRDGTYEPCTNCITEATDTSPIVSSEEEQECLTTIPILEELEDGVQ